MPAQASWYLRVPEIVTQLHAPAAPPFLDRQAIENLFRLRRRQAIRLMGLCGGYLVGKTFLVDRSSLLGYLDRLTRAGLVEEALTRKRRVSDALNESVNFIAAQQTRIAIDSGPRDRPQVALPPGIELVAPGKLQISYESAADLLARVAELASAAADDFPHFQRMVVARK